MILKTKTGKSGTAGLSIVLCEMFLRLLCHCVRLPAVFVLLLWSCMQAALAFTARAYTHGLIGVQ